MTCGASPAIASARPLHRSSVWSLAPMYSTCSSIRTYRHGAFLAAAATAAPQVTLPCDWPTLAASGRWNSATWVCHAVGPVVRRPTLRLQSRGAEPQTQTSDEGSESEEKPAEVTAGVLHGVARVQCVQDLPRCDLPLLLGSFRSSSCNAVAISYGDESYLLAPAACVVYGSQLRVVLPGRDKPFAARLLHLGMECELAVLSVDAPEFWAAVVPYELAPYGLPQLQQQVSIVSYEEGQPKPRSAPGTIMRTEVVTYPSAMQRLLGLTIAVALSKDQIGSAVVDYRGSLLGLVFARTPGSAGSGKKSGGSAGGSSGDRWGQGRRRVGRRRSRRGQTEASATVVPAPVVVHFLEDIRRHGSYLGFPTLGIQWKRTESAALRRYMGMAPDQTGVAITSINPTAALAAHARPLDALAAVGGAAVGNDGTVEFRDGVDSIHITYHISQFQVGDQVDLTFLRAGQLFTAPVVLDVPHRLLQLHLEGRPPQYLVFSGLVLTVLSAPFLEGAFGRSWAVRAPVQLLREWHNHPSRSDEQVVVVAECQDMGPGSATDGYERRAVMYQRVVRCNGVAVINLRHLTILVTEAMAKAEAGGTARAAGRGGRRRAAALRSADAPARDALPETTEANMTASADECGLVLGRPTGSAASSVCVTHELRTLDGDAVAEESGRLGARNDAAVSAKPTTTSACISCGDGGSGGPPLDPKNLVLELSNRMVLVLPLRRAHEDTREMLAEYEVQHAVSEDLRPVYEKELRLGSGARKGSTGV